MKTCEICWEEISWKWPKKYCLACSKIAYKLHQHDWREKHKAESSKKTVEMMKCEICWMETKRKSSKQRYCIKCWNAINRERTLERAREKARERDALRNKDNRTNKKED